MGNTASQGPITDKRSKDASTDQLQFGAIVMQGWRPYMVLKPNNLGRCHTIYYR